jgi:transketolase
MELKQKAKEIRLDILKMIHNAGNGHTGGSLGMADVFTALYFKVIKHDQKNPYDKKRDRLILSNGHICPVMYTCLAHSGYFPIKELMTLRKLDSRLQGHPHYRSAPGVENTGGPLGQGISVAIGHALSARLDKLDYTTYCSLGDGELNEGQVWEAFMAIAKYDLNNLVCFIDKNRMQLSGESNHIMPIEPLAEKLASFNLEVIEADGHDFDEIISAFDSAKKSERPSVIVFNTIMGKGVSFMENSYKWHGIAPDDEQYKKAVMEVQNG